MLSWALLALLTPPSYPLLCAPCHGARGDGEGPAAHLYLPPPPSLLRDTLDPEMIRVTVSGGRPGTGMPAFGGSLGAPGVDALVRQVVALRSAPAQAPRAPLWPDPLPAQGPPPLGVPPAAADLDARSCGRCHAVEWRAWGRSRHALATGPGLVGQSLSGLDTARCDRCHAPLAEQRGAALHRQGVSCAGCHLRGRRKHGPPRPSVARPPAPGVAATPDPRYQRADFCLPCHTLPLGSGPDGHPLLDTYREWAASPYLPAGVQCQHCHQPDGAHDFAGAHSSEAVRAAVRLEWDEPSVRGDEVVVVARVRNVGVGHSFPTTATPRAVLRLRLLDASGAPLAGTERSWAIGRTVRRVEGRWEQVADTRVPPGQAARRRYVAKLGEARQVEASLHLFPDWYYVGLYRRLLRRAELSPAARAQLELALKRARSSGFLVDFLRRPI